MVSRSDRGALFFDGEDDFVDLVGFSWGGEMSLAYGPNSNSKSWVRILNFEMVEKRTIFYLQVRENFPQ